jgi:hypothetical protein
MSSENVIPGVDEVEFTAEAHRDGRVLTLELTGDADLTVKARLDTFIAAVHEQARRAATQEVVVDVRRVGFMNSSCLKSFVWWISAVGDLAAEARYRITFLSSAEMYWQRRSLHALACLATDLVSVRT